MREGSPLMFKMYRLNQLAATAQIISISKLERIICNLFSVRSSNMVSLPTLINKWRKILGIFFIYTFLTKNFWRTHHRQNNHSSHFTPKKGSNSGGHRHMWKDRRLNGQVPGHIWPWMLWPLWTGLPASPVLLETCKQTTFVYKEISVYWIRYRTEI